MRAGEYGRGGEGLVGDGKKRREKESADGRREEEERDGRNCQGPGRMDHTEVKVLVNES